MVDRGLKHGAVKGPASAADMAARPFQCEWHKGCSKSFNRKSDLQRHFRIHTNERPYACDYKPCSKTFIQRSALTVHRRTHTGDKPHKCPFLGCGKCFSDSSSLARHRRIHTNDKPYICRNQRCKKAFCRKTTMTKHIRKEHPTEPSPDDQDAEYDDASSDGEDVEEEIPEIKEEAQYLESDDMKTSQITRSVSNYDTNLWRLPGATAQRPAPLQLRLSEMPGRDVKIERTSSAASQRSLSSPYPLVTRSSDHSHLRSNTMPGAVPLPPTLQQPLANGSLRQQYQLRTPDDGVGLWSPRHSMQQSPTSVTNSSPSSATTQSQHMFTSRPYQLQPTSMPSNNHMQYAQHQEAIVVPIQQPMNDLTVHEIHLDQPAEEDQFREMESGPAHQQHFEGMSQHVAQEQYMETSRDSSRHDSYSEPQITAVNQYPSDGPPTPAAHQPIPHYANPLPQQALYQATPFLPIDNLNGQFYPSHTGLIATNIDWPEDPKPEDDPWSTMPSDRLRGFGWPA